jgi:hypothetical protein
MKNGGFREIEIQEHIEEKRLPFYLPFLILFSGVFLAIGFFMVSIATLIISVFLSIRFVYGKLRKRSEGFGTGLAGGSEGVR